MRGGSAIDPLMAQAGRGVVIEFATSISSSRSKADRGRVRTNSSFSPLIDLAMDIGQTHAI